VAQESFDRLVGDEVAQLLARLARGVGAAMAICRQLATGIERHVGVVRE
jgi:hypothetical protein